MLSLDERLRRGDTILLDGALDSALRRRNIPAPLPLGTATPLLTHPTVIREIHLEYLAAGADIIRANTCRTHARSLARANMAGRSQTLTYRAITLALQARRDAGLSRSVLVAGTVCPLAGDEATGELPTLDALQSEHTHMVRHMADAGVDLVIAESMTTGREGLAVAQAAAATGLPCMISFACHPGGALPGGESLAAAVAAVAQAQPQAILLNCMALGSVLPVLRTLRGQTDLPVGAYANLGHADEDDALDTDDVPAPREYAQTVRGWLAAGAQIIGGCCGTTPAHINALAEIIYPAVSDALRLPLPEFAFSPWDD